MLLHKNQPLPESFQLGIIFYNLSQYTEGSTGINLYPNWALDLKSGIKMTAMPTPLFSSASNNFLRNWPQNASAGVNKLQQL